MTEPSLVGELLPGVLQEVIDRAGPDYERWAEQVAATGYCAHPVRLRGRIEHADPATGEVRTATRPNGSRTRPCSRRVVTGGPQPAPPAQRPTRPTVSSSWPLGCGAARACPSEWLAILGCSSPSPPPASARCIPGGRKASWYIPVIPTGRGPGARMAGGPAAGSATTRTT